MTTTETRTIHVVYNRANFANGKMEQNVSVTLPYVRGAKAIESALREFIGATSDDMVAIVSSEIVKPRTIDGGKLASYASAWFKTRDDAETNAADDEIIVESLLFTYEGYAWIYSGDFETRNVVWQTPEFLTIGRANNSLAARAKMQNPKCKILAVTECTRYIDDAPHAFFLVPNAHAEMIYKTDKNAD